MEPEQIDFYECPYCKAEPHARSMTKYACGSERYRTRVKQSVQCKLNVAVAEVERLRKLIVRLAIEGGCVHCRYGTTQCTYCGSTRISGCITHDDDCPIVEARTISQGAKP